MKKNPSLGNFKQYFKNKDFSLFMAIDGLKQFVEQRCFFPIYLPIDFSCLSPNVPELKPPDSSAIDPFRLNRNV